MSKITVLSSNSQGDIPECFGAVTGGMPILFWDACFQYLLERFEVECPEWPRNQKINQALGDLQLMACGDGAETSLATWRKVAEKRGDLSDKRERSKSSPKLRNFLATVKREITWRKVFNF